MRLTCILHYFAISVHLLALVPRVTAPLPAPHCGEGGAQLPSFPSGACEAQQVHWSRRLQHYDAVDEETRQIRDHMLKDEMGNDGKNVIYLY